MPLLSKRFVSVCLWKAVDGCAKKVKRFAVGPQADAEVAEAPATEGTVATETGKTTVTLAP